MLKVTAPSTVVVAPDKFKGSATAVTVARGLAQGLRSRLPYSVIRELPVADGGEGTVEMMLRHGFAPVSCEVLGPLGQPIAAAYASDGTTAVIEMAAASGLDLLGRPPTRRTALGASTYGAGQLLCDARDKGHRRIVVGLGGSATTDGGAGALRALGARMTSDSGAVPPLGGMGLADVERLDVAGLRETFAGVEMVVACDVDVPLTGPNGAACLFARQKGAEPQDVDILERGLVHWADIVAATIGRDARGEAGVGAAGGLAFGLASVLGARIRPAADYLLSLVGFYDVARAADLVIVGEGCLDLQSLRGKAPVGIARQLIETGPPVVAAVGVCSLGTDALLSAGFHSVYSIQDMESDPRRCMIDAEALLVSMGATIADHVTSPA